MVMRRSDFPSPPDDSRSDDMATVNEEKGLTDSMYGPQHHLQQQQQQHSCETSTHLSLPSSSSGMGGPPRTSSFGGGGGARHNVYHQRPHCHPYFRMPNTFYARRHAPTPPRIAGVFNARPLTDGQDVSSPGEGNFPPHHAFPSTPAGCPAEPTAMCVPEDTPLLPSAALTSCWPPPCAQQSGEERQHDGGSGKLSIGAQNSSHSFISPGGATAAGSLHGAVDAFSCRKCVQKVPVLPRGELEQLTNDGLTPSNGSDMNSTPSSQLPNTGTLLVSGRGIEGYETTCTPGLIANYDAASTPASTQEAGEGTMSSTRTTQPTATREVSCNPHLDLLPSIPANCSGTGVESVGSANVHERCREQWAPGLPRGSCSHKCEAATSEAGVLDNPVLAHAPSPSVCHGVAEGLKADRYLLPPQRSEHAGRATCCIDLDDTLVHTFERRPWWWNPAENPLHLEIELDISAPAEVLVERSRIRQPLYVCIRPFAKELLEFCFGTFEVVFFTTGTEEYAASIFDYLDPGRNAYRLYRHHCTVVGDSYKKDLSLLGRPLDRVILLDDRGPEVSVQPGNVVFCDPFILEGSDDPLQRAHCDDVLLSFQKLLRTLSALPPDVMLEAMRDYQDAISRLWNEGEELPPE